MAGAKTQIWYLYILKCVDDTLYIGITPDIEKRLAKHNAGKGAKYTRGRLPVILLFSTPCANRSEALQLEYRMKKLSRREKLDLIRRELKNG